MFSLSPADSDLILSAYFINAFVIILVGHGNLDFVSLCMNESVCLCMKNRDTVTGVDASVHVLLEQYQPKAKRSFFK